MLTFADSAWEVSLNFLIFCAGLWVAFAQKKTFHVPTKIAIVLYLWHTFFCLFYLWYSLNSGADSIGYFQVSQFYNDGFKFGTGSIYFVLSPLTQYFEISYGGAFLIFNIAGYIGLITFASALQTVTWNSTRRTKQLSLIILFLPGLSFWSSAIGKDALTFMGAGLATWAALDIKRRAPAMAIGIFFFLLPRPHMAGMLLASLSLALLFSSGIGTYTKLFLVLITVPTSILGIQFGAEYAGLEDISDLNEIGSYIEGRHGHNLGGGSSVDIASMSVPMRLFSYFFRPLVFDANGLLGFVVSIENLVLLFVFLSVIFRVKRTRSVLGRFQKLFYLLFVLISWLVLANTTANLGIAIRQKTMFLPMLIVLLFSYKGRASAYVIAQRKHF